MAETPTPGDVIRGGLDSLAWLLNNAHNHDTDEWDGLVKAARADRTAALAALQELEDEQRSFDEAIAHTVMLNTGLADENATLRTRVAELEGQVVAAQRR